jgi:CRP-like cAMP-binding protein
MDTLRQDHSAPMPNPVTVALKMRQRLPLSEIGDRHLYVVVRGCLLFEAKPSEDQMRVLELIYPGDAFTTTNAAHLTDAVVLAAAPSELARFRAEQITPSLDRAIRESLEHRGARRILHVSSIAGETAEARLADFIVEAGCYIGRPVAYGRLIDMSFNRDEIASYLAINPDTLSRLLSRLKSKGIISVIQRRMIVRDWQAILAASPHARAICDLFNKRPEVAV